MFTRATEEELVQGISRGSFPPLSGIVFDGSQIQETFNSDHIGPFLQQMSGLLGCSVVLAGMGSSRYLTPYNHRLFQWLIVASRYLVVEEGNTLLWRRNHRLGRYLESQRLDEHPWVQHARY